MYGIMFMEDAAASLRVLPPPRVVCLRRRRCPGDVWGLGAWRRFGGDTSAGIATAGQDQAARSCGKPHAKEVVDDK